MTDSTSVVPPLAAEGLKLLSAKHRKMHPGAQVQTLRRMAARALGQAERTEQYSHDYEAGRKLRRKAQAACEAMLYLNVAHDLGYPTGGMVAR